jgi:hypothetical protein
MLHFFLSFFSIFGIYAFCLYIDGLVKIELRNSVILYKLTSFDASLFRRKEIMLLWGVMENKLMDNIILLNINTG